MWNINAPQGHIPCEIFTKFAEFVPRFRMRYLLKFCWISSSCYGVMGVLSCQGLVIPKFSAPTMFSERSRCHPNQFPIGRVISERMNTVRVYLAVKLCVRPPKVFEVQERTRGPLSVYHHAKFGAARISPATGAAKNVEFFVCLFVCPSRF